MDGGKTCFKCGETKPLYQFYPHRQMGDGHLNKCKECAKADARRRHHTVKHDPNWLLKERERCRVKSARQRSLFGCKQPSRESKLAWNAHNKHKRQAHRRAARAVRLGIIQTRDSCEHCGATSIRLHKHHRDYLKPMEVLWLCPACHGIEHRKPPPMAA